MSIDVATLETVEQIAVCLAPGTIAVVRPGESLLKIAEAHGVPLRAGCRMGLCGADPVRITAGEEYLTPPSPAEQRTLRRLGLPPECRMACSARVRGPVSFVPAERARRPSAGVEALLSSAGARAPVAQRP
jgi:ferredoxin